MTASRSIALAALLAAGCLSSDPVGDPPIELCTSDDDCEGNELCDRGFCYGDPPQGIQFAAVLQPPGDTANVEDGRVLVPTEIPMLEIDESGQLLNLQFERHVVLRGRVEIPCEATDPARMCGAIEATIEARRPSRIPGVPRSFRTFNTRIGEGGDPEFEIALPPSLCADANECEDAWELVVKPQTGTMASIVPEGGELESVEQIAPPQTFDIVAHEDRSDVVFELGRLSELKLVSGRISRTMTAAGERGYKVRAFGRETGLGDPIRASTIAVTDSSGSFSLWVRTTGLNQTFDFLFEPGELSEGPLPVVRLPNQLVLELDDNTTAHELLPVLLPNIPVSVNLSVPITAASTAGDTVPVGGATVLFSTEFDTTGIVPTIEATFSTQITSAATEDDGPMGTATASLFAGTSYDVVVLPPPDSEFSAQFDAQAQTGTSSGVAGAIVLERRNALRGIMVNSDGDPIVAAPVTAQASPRFMFELELDTDPEESTIDITQLIRQMTFSVVTGADGSFFMWVDGDLSDQDAAYDLSIEPPLGSDAPRWSFEDVGAQAESTDLGTLTVPRAAYTQGFITDADGQPVPGAKLEVYELTTSAEFCDNLCTPAPILRGTFVANSEGEVRPVVLPDPSNASARR